MKFGTPENAMECLLHIFGLDIKSAKVEELPDLKIVESSDEMILENPDASAKEKERINQAKALQKGYQVETPTGKIKFVIDVFEDGWCCWVFTPDGSFRL